MPARLSTCVRECRAISAQGLALSNKTKQAHSGVDAARTNRTKAGHFPKTLARSRACEKAPATPGNIEDRFCIAQKSHGSFRYPAKPHRNLPTHMRQS
jgi:hypothetical protein